jgi:membrane-associated phospholipid phosphatase
MSELKSHSSVQLVASLPDGHGVEVRDRNLAYPGKRISREWAVCGLLVLAGLLALAVDVPLSRTMVQGNAFKSLHGLLESIEPFGRPPAVIAVSLAVLLCGGIRRGAGFRIAAGALLSGLAVDLLKLCVGRIRPRHFDFLGNVFDTFSGVLQGSGPGSAMQSWPSGHTGTAVGFCLALSAIFPEARWLFRILAALVALQRIESGAHYLSDTLFAASVAVVIHIVVFGSGPVGRAFGRIESRWAARSSLNS